MFTFRLNDESESVGDIPPQTTLLDYLRDRGLTGSKEGCAEGECGACAVAVVSPHGTGSAYRVINSCLAFVPTMAGREVYTVESLARNGELCEAQQAMAAAGGSQCGYCTPGFVMSLFAEQHRPGRVGPCDPAALSGNLCRCTGYRPIRDAALSLGPPAAGPFFDRLRQPAAPIRGVRTPGFSRPETLDEAIAILHAGPEAVVLAGGTDLAVESNLRHRRWPHLVSLDAIDTLQTFAETDDAVRVGAALPLTDVGARWTSAPAAIREWVGLFASPLIRHRATLGGNLATASPIGDAAPLLLALDAEVETAGPSGRRTLPLTDFFVGYRKSALHPGEIITTVVIPKPLPSRLSFYKVAKRRLDDISTVAAAMSMDVDADGRVVKARFAFGGVAATPVRVREAETAIGGSLWDAHAVDRVQRVLQRVLDPLSDRRGSKEYRLAVAQSLVEKFWAEHRA